MVWAMFLKNVKKFYIRLPIKTKLSLMISFATVALISLLMCIIYYSLGDIFHRVAYHSIDDEMNSISAILKKKFISRLALHDEIDWDRYQISNAEKRSFFYFVNIRDQHNHLFAKTEYHPRRPVSMHMPALMNLPHKDGEYLQHHMPNGQNYIIYAKRIFFSKYRSFHVMLGYNFTYQQRILDSFFRVSVFLFIVAFLLTALLCFIISDRCLKQLKKLIGFSEEITVDKLHSRIEANTLPQELMPLADSINQMLERIHHSYQNLERFSKLLSHEMRTPVQIIMNAAEMGKGLDTMPDEVSSQFDSIYEESHKLKMMINNLLFLSRYDQDKFQLYRAEVIIQDEINSTIFSLQCLSQPKSIELHCRGEAVAQTDPILFRRMMSNLLENAIKYSHPKSQVFIDITNSESEVVISVKDQGIGIAPQALPQITQCFYRSQQADDHEKAGIGVGLHIVNIIVKLHAGDLEIQSEPHQGTTVVIRLPHVIIH